MFFSIQRVTVTQFLYFQMFSAEDTKRHITVEHSKDPSIHEIETKNARSMLYKSSIRKKLNRSLRSQMHDSSKIKNERKKEPNLKALVTKNKVQILKKNFINKLGVNGTYREPFEDLEQMGNSVEKNFCSIELFNQLKKTNGLKIGNLALTIWTIMNILHSTLMVFVFSIMMAFPATIKDPTIWNLRLFSTGIYLIDIALNCVVERSQKGKLLSNIQEITEFYWRNHALVDIISFFVFSLDLVLDVHVTILTTFVALVRFANSRKKIEKIEYLYIDSTEKEHYYGLVKVFLTNFAIGHILSILLNLMAGISQHENWWMKIDIVKSSWFSKYVWGYYWGTNIMLTVGFGDLAASNEYQAIILIFIETFSCITLAYNISYVGGLISQLNKNEEEKKKKLKFFHKMCKENQIPTELQSKIANYIQESYEIKEGFCFDEYDQVLDSLPKEIQMEYRKESNKVVFDGLGFLNNLSKKSLLNMAEVIERKICHPNEFLFRKGDKSEFVILQKGKLCSACQVNSEQSRLNGKTIETLQVGKNEKPKMISLDFIKNKSLNYDIKSDGYTILYRLSLQNFKEALRQSEMDYQLYCLLRDRSECILDEQKLYLCEVCEDKYHNKFECSRLHYCPLKQIVIYKHLNHVKYSKTPRRKFFRLKNRFCSLLEISEIKESQNKFKGDYNLSCDEKKEIDAMETSQANRYKNFKRKNSKIKFEKKQKENNLKSKNTSDHFQYMEQIIDKIEKIVNQKPVENFWGIETDEAYNFRFYFKHSNPSNINKSMVKAKTVFH